MKHRMKRILALTAALAVLAMCLYAAAEGNDPSGDVPVVFTPLATLTVYVDGEASSELTGEYAWGESVTLSAPAAASGGAFSHWALSSADGAYLSASRNLTLPVNADLTLYAVYGASHASVPAAEMLSVTGTHYAGEASIACNMYYSVPPVYTLKSAGIRYTSNQILGVKDKTLNLKENRIPNMNVTEILESDRTGGKVRVMSVSEDDLNGGNWTLYLTPSGEDVRYYALPYVVVEKDGAEETIFGGMRSVTFDTLESGLSGILELGDLSDLGELMKEELNS